MQKINNDIPNKSFFLRNKLWGLHYVANIYLLYAIHENIKCHEK